MSTPRPVQFAVASLLAFSLGTGCSKGGAEASAEAAEARPAAGQQAAVRPTVAALADSGIDAAPEREVDPLVEFRAGCPPAAKRTLECEYLRSLIVAQVALALEELERSRDQRGVAHALAALELHGEPEIQIAACRVLAGFPDTPALAASLPPLLDSPYLEVQRIAARLMSRHPDPALAAVGQQWTNNHGGATVSGPYGELDFPAHYAAMGFPDIPGSERYTPADTDRSLAWWTTEPAPAIAARIGQMTGARVLTYVQWAELASQRYTTAAQSAHDPKQVEELQRLGAEYAQSQDAKVLEKIQAIQQQMVAAMEQAQTAQMNAVERVVVPPATVDYEQARVVILDEKQNRVTRAILVYRQPGLERTVIQTAWDLTDYPPAWKRPGEES